MHSRTLLTIASTALVLGNAAAFQLPAGKKVAADSIVGAVIRGDYDHSFHLSDSLARMDTNDPLAPLLKLVAIGLRDLDFDVNIDTLAFESQYQSAVAAITAWEAHQGRSSYSLTMLGFSKATYASYNLRRKRYVGTIQTGLEALDHLRQAKQMDSTNADADYFLGLYEYARSDLRKRLWWVLFWVAGDKVRGVRRLETAAGSAQLASTAAMLSLADVYTQMQEYDKAAEQLRLLETRFPSSRFVLWSRAKYHEARKEFDAAAQWYGTLSSSYVSAGVSGRYNALATGYKQAQMLGLGGQRTRSADLCRSILGRYGNDAGSAPAAVCRETNKLLERMDARD
jgi:tetratricopeptide (TPR) repeat protein